MRASRADRSRLCIACSLKVGGNSSCGHCAIETSGQISIPYRSGLQKPGAWQVVGLFWRTPSIRYCVDSLLCICMQDTGIHHFAHNANTLVSGLPMAAMANQIFAEVMI